MNIYCSIQVRYKYYKHLCEAWYDIIIEFIRFGKVHFSNYVNFSDRDMSMVSKSCDRS